MPGSTIYINVLCRLSIIVGVGGGKEWRGTRKRKRRMRERGRRRGRGEGDREGKRGEKMEREREGEIKNGRKVKHNMLSIHIYSCIQLLLNHKTKARVEQL